MDRNTLRFLAVACKGRYEPISIFSSLLLAMDQIRGNATDRTIYGIMYTNLGETTRKDKERPIYNDDIKLQLAASLNVLNDNFIHTIYQGIGSVNPCAQNFPPCSALVALTIKSAYSFPHCSAEMAPGIFSGWKPISPAVFRAISVTTRPFRGEGGLACVDWMKSGGEGLTRVVGNHYGTRFLRLMVDRTGDMVDRGFTGAV